MSFKNEMGIPYTYENVKEYSLLGKKVVLIPWKRVLLNEDLMR
jgi:hypothetical protein